MHLADTTGPDLLPALRGAGRSTVTIGRRYDEVGPPQRRSDRRR